MKPLLIIISLGGGLTPLLAPRKLPGALTRPQPFETDRIEAEITFAMRYSEVRLDASVSALEENESLFDLERMGVSDVDS